MRSKKEQIMERALHYKELKGSLAAITQEFSIDEWEIKTILGNWWDKAVELSRTVKFEYEGYVVFVMIWWWFIKMAALIDWKDVKRFSNSYEKFPQTDVVRKVSSLLINYINENARTNLQPESPEDTKWSELKWDSSASRKWSSGREKARKN